MNTFPGFSVADAKKWILQKFPIGTWNTTKNKLGQNLRFDLKWPHLTLEFWDACCGLTGCPTNKSKKTSKMVTFDLGTAQKFQFCKSIFSKFWKILELEMKIFIYFDPKKPKYTIFGPIPEHSTITVFGPMGVQSLVLEIRKFCTRVSIKICSFVLF